MKAIDKIFNYLFLLIVVVYAILIIVDIIGVISNPEEYRTAHHFPEEQLSLQSESVIKYIGGNIAMLSVFLLLFFVGMKKLQNVENKKLWNILYYTCAIGFFIAIVYGYYQWAATGFDH